MEAGRRDSRGMPVVLGAAVGAVATITTVLTVSQCASDAQASTDHWRDLATAEACCSTPSRHFGLAQQAEQLLLVTLLIHDLGHDHAAQGEQEAQEDQQRH